MEKYIPIFQFEILHDYFDNKKCTFLSLEICEKCKKVSRNYGLILTHKGLNKYTLIMKVNENIPELIESFKQNIIEDKEFFMLKLLVQKKQFYCLTKKLPNISDSERLFGIIEKIDQKTNVKFRIDKLEKQNPIIKQQFNSPNVLALLQFNLEKKSINKAIENNEPIKTQIIFESSSAYWKYILFPRSANESKLNIVDTSNNISFSPVKWTKFHDTQKAGESLSTNKIKLSESPPFHLQLWENCDHGKKLILSELTIPNPEITESYSLVEDMNNYITIYQYF